MKNVTNLVAQIWKKLLPTWIKFKCRVTFEARLWLVPAELFKYIPSCSLVAPHLTPVQTTKLHQINHHLHTTCFYVEFHFLQYSGRVYLD